jgi:nucleoside 2-deoxyribosyltransferase
MPLWRHSVDSGTAAEIGYAYGIGRRILGYRSDYRLSAENEGSLVNLQVEFYSIINEIAFWCRTCKNLDADPTPLSGFCP